MPSLSRNLREQLGGAESLREAELLERIRRANLPEPMLQYRVVPKRRYRWDFAWPDYKVCAELHGGLWTMGAHNRAKGIRRDAEKSNLAALWGWYQLTLVPEDVKDGAAVILIGDALYFRGWRGNY